MRVKQKCKSMPESYKYVMSLELQLYHVCIPQIVSNTMITVHRNVNLNEFIIIFHAIPQNAY